jgi:hypothetical protein
MFVAATAWTDPPVLVALSASGVTVVALLASIVVSRRQLRLARQANALPAVVQLFEDSRNELWGAREFVNNSSFVAAGFPVDDGFDGLPEEVKRLAWYYDQLGALVAHDIIDVELVSGYIGGSMRMTWERLRPYIETERRRRASSPDPMRWQEYFENLAALIDESPPAKARSSSKNWRLKTEKHAHLPTSPARGGGVALPAAAPSSDPVDLDASA